MTGAGYDRRTLKSVEAYDHHENKWNNLRDMLYEISVHALVTIVNKMFVISMSYEEVPFYCITRNLTLLSRLNTFSLMEGRTFIVLIIKLFFFLFQVPIV